jgi:hypothetical protein
MTQSLEWTLQEALGSIDGNLLLPPEEKKMLLDALSAAGTLSWEYGKSFEERRDCVREMSSLFGEHASKIAACACELLIAMRGDIMAIARAGDWRLLRTYLKRGHHQGHHYLVEKEILDFLLDISEGKKRKKQRPHAATFAVRNREIIWFVMAERDRGVKDEQSIARAAEKFHLGKRTIQGIASTNAINSERSILAQVRALQKEIDDLIAKLTSYYETKWAHTFAK